MDFPRSRRRRFDIKVPAIVSCLAILLVATAMNMRAILTGSNHLKSVQRAAIVIDSVAQETITRSVRAEGVLVSGQIAVVSSTSDGIVTEVAARVGQRVDRSTVIVIIRNPDVEASVSEAAAKVEQAKSDFLSVVEEASASHLNHLTTYQTAYSDEAIDDAQADAYANLAREGLISTLTYRQAQIKGRELRALVRLEAKQIAVDLANQNAKISAARVAETIAKNALRIAESKRASLVIRAGTEGVLQNLSANIGQSIAAGASLGHVVNDHDLKAVLQVPDGDVHDLVPGLAISLTTDSAAKITGHLLSLAPTSENGSISVDVSLDSSSVKLRPAEQVEGTINTFRLPRALSIIRPPGVADNSVVDLFCIQKDSDRAIKTTVQIGEGSSDRVAIRGGLHEGDQVIVSDMSAYGSEREVEVTK